MGFRKIIHVDLDAFFCAVEELRNPGLKGLPFAVGGQPNQRGVVASCSYPARKFGIHSAMPMGQAIRLCPKLVIVPADHRAYSQSSHRVMEIFHRITALVEQISIDEAFLDVSDLPQPGLEQARNLQTTVHTETGLPCSLGVASNKLVAKIATDTAKKRHGGSGYPDAILEVPAGQEAEFLSPLPVSALWGVGPKTASALAEMNIKTIGDLAKSSEALLAKKFGKNGLDLVRHARGIDDRPVVTEHDVKSISEEVTFDHDIKDEKILLATLRSLSEGVGKQMRRENLSGTTFRLKLRWPDFTTLTRQVTLSQAVDQDTVIYEAARGLFYRVWNPGKAVRLLGVGMSGLTQGVRQLTLWDSAETKEKKLLDALDALHQKFGDKSVQLGYNFKNKRVK